MRYFPTKISLTVVEILLYHLTAAFASQETRILSSLDKPTRIGVTHIPLIDKKRLDPFTNYSQQRELMVSVYYPAKRTPSEHILQQQLKPDDWHNTVSYMPPVTAALCDELVIPFGFPNNIFEQLSSICQLNSPMQDVSTAYSLLIFSPGGGAPRFFYTTVMEDLARKGYMVAAIDHPYDALAVEFPNGRIIIGLNKTLTSGEVELLVTVRAQDISFVIDELSRKYSDTINTTDVIAFGHSLGGAAVAEAMRKDTRIRGGINIDGRLFGSMEKSNNTLSKPFLQFASESSSSNPYWRWDEEWERLLGWKLELVLNDAAHSTFTDLPLIAEAFDLRDKLGRFGEQLLGKLEGLRGLEIMIEYVSAFTQFVLKGKNGSLMGSDGNDAYPEVVVKRHLY